ncbi:RHS repeat-associated core domain-containing protein [Pseudomonas kermanshahensis]|uniref:RHS repeat-associated core domain-containing protein n=1 Tax=Pseudomonas kermanshahensis TaxID=2745482 RepID=UPI0023DAC66A|nr:RHS repeat-associated core domain-containing protein [Pseudomonas kermanshahensis]WEL55902.1 RHS repeat-associated core domain-containing protein [Pseudomonas kermanshahensis]
MSKASNRSLFFNQGDKLITVKQGDEHRAIFRNAEQPLAEQMTNGDRSIALLATGDKGSVLSVKSKDDKEDHLYSAYGHDPTLPSLRTTTGFNGEVFDIASTCYLLGLGYRAYSPNLRRFLAADSWSPFGQGGLNAYCFCAGDPINFSDASGHARMSLPNGQIIIVSNNSAKAGGFWLKPSTLKRTTSLDSVLKPGTPNLPSKVPTPSATQNFQRPKKIQTLDSSGEPRSDRVLQVVRSAGNLDDLIYIQESQLADLRYNQNALKYYRKSLASHEPGEAPDSLRKVIKLLKLKVEREIRFGKFLWDHAPSTTQKDIRS